MSGFGGRVGGHRPLKSDTPLGDPPRNRDQMTETLVAEAEARKQAVVVACSLCGWQWPCCFLPMDLARAAKLMMDARCPKGCHAPVVLPSSIGD